MHAGGGRGRPSAALARLARGFGLSWRGEVPDDVVARGDSVIGSNWEGGPLSGSGLGVQALETGGIQATCAARPT